MTDLRAVGDRIAELLDQLAGLPDRRAGLWSDELAACLSDLYGAGLARIVEIACAPDGPRGHTLLEQLAADDLVGSLLLVHDLHPSNLSDRVEELLAELRVAIPEVDVRLVQLDAEAGAIKLRLVGPPGRSAAAELERRVREIVAAKTPELETIEIDRLLEATPVRVRLSVGH